MGIGGISIYLYVFFGFFWHQDKLMLNTRVVRVQSHFQIIHSPRVPKAIDLTLYELSV